MTERDYQRPPAPSLEIGTRVRKQNYSDTGTVDQIPVHPSQAGLIHVIWDHTGESWEQDYELGRADA